MYILKKVEKTTRPFRYDLNEIPYDYTVEVRNRFKGLNPMEFAERPRVGRTGQQGLKCGI